MARTARTRRARAGRPITSAMGWMAGLTVALGVPDGRALAQALGGDTSAPASGALATGGFSETGPIGGPALGRGLGEPTIAGVGGTPDVRLGGPLGTGETLATRPQVVVTPSITGIVEYDSNIDGIANGRSDEIIQIQPSVTVQADTARLHAFLSYTPQIAFFVEHDNESFVGHQLNANAQATIIPDLFYVDASAYAALEPRNGGLGALGAGGGFGGYGGGGFSQPSFPTGANSYGVSGANGRANENQISSFSIEPYVVQRFGDLFTVRAGVEIDETSGGNDYYARTNGTSGVGTTSDNQVSEREALDVTSGDVLGRFRDVVSLSASQYQGNGVNSGAYENYATDELGYAVTRTFTVFVEGGFEDIRYGTLPVTRIDDEVWSVGLRAAPNPDSVIILGYGHRFGFNAAFANVNYNITARTNLHGSYSTSLGTALGQIQSLVSGSGLDPNGDPVDPSTGAPRYISGGLLGTAGNGNLYRLKQLSVGLTTIYTRDSFSLSLLQDERQVVGSSEPFGLNPLLPADYAERNPFFGSGHDLSVQLGWQHAVSDITNLSASGVYGITHQSGESGHDTFVEFDLGASTVLSDKLTGFVRYDYNKRFSEFANFSYDAHVILLGLTRTF